ncbi:MAG: hypothetical protein MHMPM18_001833 [Marteilia pararefringens]
MLRTAPRFAAGAFYIYATTWILFVESDDMTPIVNNEIQIVVYKKGVDAIFCVDVTKLYMGPGSTFSINLYDLLKLPSETGSHQDNGYGLRSTKHAEISISRTYEENIFEVKIVVPDFEKKYHFMPEFVRYATINTENHTSNLFKLYSQDFRNPSNEKSHCLQEYNGGWSYKKYYCVESDLSVPKVFKTADDLCRLILPPEFDILPYLSSSIEQNRDIVYLKSKNSPLYLQDTLIFVDSSLIYNYDDLYMFCKSNSNHSITIFYSDFKRQDNLRIYEEIRAEGQKFVECSIRIAMDTFLLLKCRFKHLKIHGYKTNIHIKSGDDIIYTVDNFSRSKAKASLDDGLNILHRINFRLKEATFALYRINGIRTSKTDDLSIRIDFQRSSATSSLPGGDGNNQNDSYSFSGRLKDIPAKTIYLKSIFIFFMITMLINILMTPIWYCYATSNLLPYN